MRSFTYERAASPAAALQAFEADETATMYLAGGTTLLDLMKLDVLRPARVVDISGLDTRAIELSDGRLRLGAAVKMAEAARHDGLRGRIPMLTQTLTSAASTQIRNMASLGGNVLQRTRCPYFRDVSWSACNKRSPGSGCAALQAVNRMHAVLGTSSACVATYPGDFAQALMALDAEVELTGAGGDRIIPFAELHRLPDDEPHIETNLAPGELIVAFRAQIEPWMRRSLYLKLRDRESYEFALASAAVALDLDGGTIRQARIALGGVATAPWRARAAEDAIVGKMLSEATAQLAADIAFSRAQPLKDNTFKLELGRRTLARALLQAGSMEA
jgi:xanthine dehydrogenase YagS FAD-binding subunit